MTSRSMAIPRVWHSLAVVNGQSMPTSRTPRSKSSGKYATNHPSLLPRTLNLRRLRTAYLAASCVPCRAKKIECNHNMTGYDGCLKDGLTCTWVKATHSMKECAFGMKCHMVHDHPIDFWGLQRLDGFDFADVEHKFPADVDWRQWEKKLYPKGFPPVGCAKQLSVHNKAGTKAWPPVWVAQNVLTKIWAQYGPAIEEHWGKKLNLTDDEPLATTKTRELKATKPKNADARPLRQASAMVDGERNAFDALAVKDADEDAEVLRDVHEAYHGKYATVGDFREAISSPTRRSSMSSSMSSLSLMGSRSRRARLEQTSRIRKPTGEVDTRKNVSTVHSTHEIERPDLFGRLR